MFMYHHGMSMCCERAGTITRIDRLREDELAVNSINHRPPDLSPSATRVQPSPLRESGCLLPTHGALQGIPARPDSALFRAL